MRDLISWISDRICDLIGTNNGVWLWHVTEADDWQTSLSIHDPTLVNNLEGKLFMAKSFYAMCTLCLIPTVAGSVYVFYDYNNYLQAIFLLRRSLCSQIKDTQSMVPSIR